MAHNLSDWRRSRVSFSLSIYVVLILMATEVVVKLYDGARSSPLRASSTFAINSSPSVLEAHIEPKDLSVYYPPAVSGNETDPNYYTHYPINPSNKCLNRASTFIEFARILGLEPTKENLAIPRTLVVGQNTALGRAVLSTLDQSKVIKLGCRNAVDFTYTDATEILALTKIDKAIVTCGAEYPFYSESDGYAYVNGEHGNYIKGLFDYLHKASIPFVYAVELHMPDSHAQLVTSNGGKAIVFPSLLSPYSAVGVAARECTAASHSLAEYFTDADTLSSITPAEAASYIISSFSSKFNTIKLASKDSIALSKAFENAKSFFPNCNLTIRKSPHIVLSNSIKFESDTIGTGSINNFLATLPSLPSEKPEKPYLSIIIGGRHDNYAGGVEVRIQNSINSIAQGLYRNPLATIEMIFVDFNSDPKSGTMATVLKIPDGLKGSMRYIIAPNEFAGNVSNRIKTNLEFPEFVVKNLGIRRAKGDFILSTNADNLFPSTFFELIARKEFNPGVFYRNIRRQAPPHSSHHFTIEQIVQKIGDIWSMPSGVWDGDTGAVKGTRFSLISNHTKYSETAFPFASGDFMMLSRGMWDVVGGLPEVGANRNTDTLFMGKLMKLTPGYAHHIIQPIIFHQYHIHVDWNRPWVRSLDESMSQFMCYGYSSVMGEFNQFEDWGFPSAKFNEIIV